MPVSVFGDGSAGATDTNRVFSMSMDLEVNIVIHVFINKTWCYEGKRIVPVTVQIWDCLSSPLGTALKGKVSVTDP